MKKVCLLLFAILLAAGSSGCSFSSTKKGKVVDVAVSFSLNDMMEGTIDHPVYGNTVTVQTGDGNKYEAEWDESLLGRPVDMDLAGVEVTIQPTKDPKVWKVTQITAQGK